MNPHALTRREFVGSVASVILTARPAASRALSFADPPRTLRVGLVLPTAGGRLADAARDVSSGAALALSETERAGQLFDQRIQLVERKVESPGNDPTPIASAARELITNSRVSVVIGGLSDAEARRLGQIAEEQRVLFLNVGARGDSLRREDCRPFVYHVAPSDAMVASAISATHDTPPHTTIELWNSALERYGGSQLNDRFRARFARPMSSFAWAAWAAVKIVWETSLRAQSVEPAKLVAVLDNAQTHFDGHKGAPLSFRSWDHQLRQPLYAVAHDIKCEHVVAELPDVGRNPQESMEEQLDRFGADGRTPMCVERSR